MSILSDTCAALRTAHLENGRSEPEDSVSDAMFQKLFAFLQDSVSDKIGSTITIYCTDAEG